jgi:hypothetical protein
MNLRIVALILPTILNAMTVIPAPVILVLPELDALMAIFPFHVMMGIGV